jgi:hypothetical protein
VQLASAIAAAVARSGSVAAPKMPGTVALVASAAHLLLTQNAITQSLLPLLWHVARAFCSALLCELCPCDAPIFSVVGEIAPAAK